jgi:hypothetical protein
MKNKCKTLFTWQRRERWRTDGDARGGRRAAEEARPSLDLLGGESILWELEGEAMAYELR